jgi:hypothetical protein
MALLKRLFRRTEATKTQRHIDPEAEAIFERLHRLMSDEHAQNEKLPEPWKSRVQSGLGCDKLPGATGEFGRHHQNPVPVNGPLGSVLYLSSLRTNHMQCIMFHRLGSVQKTDAYEAVSLDGTIWDVLFLHLYHPRKSRRAPAGYSISKSAERKLILGTNEWVDGFPLYLQDAIRDTNERLLGLPMRPPAVRKALEQGSFVRPADHQVRLGEVMKILEIKQM